MLSSKKIDREGSSRQVLICLIPPLSPARYTLYVHVLINTGKGGGGREHQREG
jgi:hypothetical protein